MAGLLKDLYSIAFYNTLTDALTGVISSFDSQHFLEQIYTDDFEHKELKERMRHTSEVLNKFLPSDYDESVLLILQLVEKLKQNRIGEDGLAWMFIPDYIEVYGLDHYQTSVRALELITQFVSCEFAVRPFLLKYGDSMMEQMKKWSFHENHKVRRFASEGCRPRLPWGKAVPALKNDPSLVMEVLENLRSDPSEWVRRSVANNLNDIAKDHPGIVLALARSWMGISRETDAIIKHGCRTLLKQGHPEILQHYGLRSENIEIKDFEIRTPQVKIGDSVEFSFVLSNHNQAKQMIRLEYGLYYKKANKQLSKKVFKISEKMYEPNTRVKVERRQSFRLITTRTFYAGEHQLSLIINGEEKAKLPFTLLS